MPTLRLCLYQDNKLDQKTDKMLTHISDAMGYALWYLDPMGRTGKPITITNVR